MHVGDGYCDGQYNTMECNYDDGDCCETTCASVFDFDSAIRSRDDAVPYACGAAGYVCIDRAFLILTGFGGLVPLRSSFVR